MTDQTTITEPAEVFFSASKVVESNASAKAVPLSLASELVPQTGTSTLGKIITHKQLEISALYKAGADDLFSADLSLSEKSFRKSLCGIGPGFIFEVKRASPSKGNIASEINIDDITGLYNKSANCISVLTDEKFFNGSYDVLKSVAKNSSKPILCKDFFIDPLQVYMARAAGADAILLMLSVLSDKAYVTLREHAEKLSMDVLTEVHDELELDRAINLKANLIGINNRNLKDLTINLDTTEILAPKIPEDTVVISESGIESRHDILRLGKLVDGFLIGSSIMGAPNPSDKIKELTLGKVKICGLTRIKDAIKAQHLGATYGGLILVDESPRYVSFEQALKIRRSAQLQFVGVFKNAPLDRVQTLVEKLNLCAVQLHGDENENYRKSLRARLPKSTEIWQAQKIKDYIPASPTEADRVLYDTYHPLVAGGTGQSFDWGLLDNTNPFVLAGGIDPTNIFDAVKTGTDILDINSGVETSPGIKSTEKLEKLVTALRGIGNKTKFSEIGADT